MNVDKVNNPFATIAHWLITSGVLISVITFANSTENKTLENETKLESIKEQQAEIKQDVKDGRQEQKKMLELLYQIKGEVKK